MAKPPRAGEVKTRLRPILNDVQCAAVHAAMTRCLLQRVAHFAMPEDRLVLAMNAGVDQAPAADEAPGGERGSAPRLLPNPVDALDPEATAPTEADSIASETSEQSGLFGEAPERCWVRTPQGEGDLGARLRTVGTRLEGDGPIVFLGCDAPDVPGLLFRMARAVAVRQAALETRSSRTQASSRHGAQPRGGVGGRPRRSPGRACVGPAWDGGYWTLAAPATPFALLDGIDWGTANVYHQTVDAARRAGIELTVLPRWSDTDQPTDFAALQRRLSRLEATRSEGPGEGSSDALPASGEQRPAERRSDRAPWPGRLSWEDRPLAALSRALRAIEAGRFDSDAALLLGRRA